jgi:hypothetical protein
MMKQPAENTNATAEEMESARERAQPLDTIDSEGVEALARQLATEAGRPVPDPEDRRRAQEIARNLRNVQAKP